MRLRFSGLAIIFYSLYAFSGVDQNFENGKNAEAIGNYKKAAQSYRRAQNTMSVPDPATIGLSRVLIEIGEVDEALDLLTEYCEKVNPLNSEVHFLLADIYLKKNLYEQAVKSVKTAEGLQPGSPQVAEKRAVAYFKLGRYKEAIPLLTKALSRNSNVILRQYRAEAYFSLNEWEKAVKDLKTNIEEKPDLHEANRLLAKCYLKQENWADAEGILQYLLKINAKDAEALAQISEVYAATDRMKDQIAVLKKLIAVEPANLKAGQLLSAAYISSKLMKSAEEELNRQLSVNPDFEEAAKQLTQLLLEQKRYEQLGTFLKFYVQNHLQAIWALSRYIQTLVKFEQYQFAENFLKNNYSSSHRNADYFLLLGYVYFKSGQIKEALATLGDAQKKYSDDARFSFNLGLVYEKTSNFEQALANYKRILDKDALAAKAHTNIAYVYEAQKKSDRNVSSASTSEKK